MFNKTAINDKILIMNAIKDLFHTKQDSKCLSFNDKDDVEDIAQKTDILADDIHHVIQKEIIKELPAKNPDEYFTPGIGYKISLCDFNYLLEKYKRNKKNRRLKILLIILTVLWIVIYVQKFLRAIY